MYKKLESKQQEKNYTDIYMAKKLNISLRAYVNKKKTGKFTLDEGVILAAMFDESIDSLFELDKE